MMSSYLFIRKLEGNCSIYRSRSLTLSRSLSLSFSLPLSASHGAHVALCLASHLIQIAFNQSLITQPSRCSLFLFLTLSLPSPLK